MRNLKNFWSNLLDGTQKLHVVESDLKRLESSAELLLQIKRFGREKISSLYDVCKEYGEVA